MTKPPDISDMDAECLRLGRGVLLTGLRHAVKILQTQIAQVEAGMYVPPPQIGNGARGIRPAMQRTLDLAGARLATDERTSLLGPLLPRQPNKKRGSTKRIKDGSGIKAFWAKMTPAERSAEMKRRMVKSGRTVKQPNHPRNKDHPKHKQWLAKITEARWPRGVKRKTVPAVKLKA